MEKCDFQEWMVNRTTYSEYIVVSVYTVHPCNLA